MQKTVYTCDICSKEIPRDQIVFASVPIEVYVENLPENYRYDICRDCYNEHIKPLFEKKEVKKRGKRT